MRSPFRLLTIAFVLAFAGPSLWRRRPATFRRSCKRFGGLVRREAAKISHGPSTTEQARWVGPRSSSSHIRPTILRSRPRHFVTLTRSAREPFLRLA